MIKMLLYLYIFFSLMVGIVFGTIIFATTGDWHPLADNTIGKLAGADKQIKGSIIAMQETDNPIVKGALIGWIGDAFVFIILIIYFMYMIGKKFFTEVGLGPGSKMFLLLITIMILGAAQMIYALVTTPDDIGYPYEGVITLFKNPDILKDALLAKGESFDFTQNITEVLNQTNGGNSSG